MVRVGYPNSYTPEELGPVRRLRTIQGTESLSINVMTTFTTGHCYGWL